MYDFSVSTPPGNTAATSMRIPLAMVLSRTSLGLDGIWWALTLTSVAKGIIFYLTFRYQMREKC